MSEMLSADSYNSAPPRGGTGLTWTRVFFPYGKMAHFRESGMGCPVLYHENADPSYLRGTGSQEEYDIAAAMPLCPECHRIQGLYANYPDPRLGVAHGTDLREAP